LKITFLGTGTSNGVPVIGCTCEVCLSVDFRDKRLRTSILIEHDDTTVVVDTGPDFRQQMLTNKVNHLDAVLFTHEHKDHIAGLDDTRVYNYIQKKDMPVYAERRVIDHLKKEFAYIFEDSKYPGVPHVEIHEIDETPFNIGKIDFVPIRVQHYKLPILGFRIGNFAYVTDAKLIEDSEMNKLKNLDVLVLNALQHLPHISHYTLEEALAVIHELQPKKVYLTHISHYLGLHKEVDASLSDQVSLAYDGLKITV